MLHNRRSRGDQRQLHGGTLLWTNVGGSLMGHRLPFPSSAAYLPCESLLVRVGAKTQQSKTYRPALPEHPLPQQLHNDWPSPNQRRAPLPFRQFDSHPCMPLKFPQRIGQPIAKRES